MAKHRALAPDRWGGKNFSPIGRGPATWENENYPDVHPDDRGIWEWLQERQKALASLELDGEDDALFWDRVSDLEERQRALASLEDPRAHLPEDTILYDIERGLDWPQPDMFDRKGRLKDDAGLAAWDRSWDRVSDLHDCTLRAFRRTTSADEWIYAICEVVGWYRFWPHRAPEGARWYVSAVPDGDDQFFVSQDFHWGIISLFSVSRWVMCVFGEPLVKAFQAEGPQAFTHPIADLPSV